MQDARLNAVLMSLPLSAEMPADGVDGNVEAETAQHILAYLAAARREMAATTLVEDQELMHTILTHPPTHESASMSSTVPNTLLLAAINYRMERKRLLERAITVLRGYLTVLGVPT
mmetsp:Transcript_91673/g.134012  ORF Transcript_91673/g.134012 Transcript_91673/m.134012 type:complete len:116 (+) Transcript_91673:42-389(+)